MSEPKHSGCYDCGSREQEFLVGHAPPGLKFTLALCDQCRVPVPIIA